MNRLARRVAHLEASLPPPPPTAALTPELREAVERVAAQEGLDPDEVLAEAGALVREMAAAGAVTLEQQVAYLADRDGMSESELFAALEAADHHQQGHTG